jgi:hypothetical protein
MFVLTSLLIFFMIWRNILVSSVWYSIEKIREDLITKALSNAEMITSEVKFDKNGWSDIIWTSESFRRAHLSIVDERKGRGMMMLHFCVFPHLHNTAPIFGMDIIAGERKITGAFIDFSPIVENHSMDSLFKSIVDIYEWRRERVLPDWAKSIFSEHIVAAGNVTDEDELSRLIRLSKSCVISYLDSVEKYNNTAKNDEVIIAQNRYAIHQKQNPRLHSSLKSFGLSDDEIISFVNDCLFPEV